MNKEMEFFILLLESYAAYKHTTADEVLKLWDTLELTDFIFEMIQRYHIERIENAFEDIDRLIAEKQNKLQRILITSCLSILNKKEFNYPS